MKKTPRNLLTFLFLLLGAAGCWAQFTGGVQGTVEDSKGGVLTQVTVTLTNVDTGVTQKAESNSSGVYRFVSLAPGNYKATAVVAGFNPASVAFTLTTDQTRDVPLVLSVASVSATLTVTSEAPLIDTSDSRNEQTLSQQQLLSLPLPNRNPTTMIILTPGVTGLGSACCLTYAPENSIDASANGRGANGNQYIVDGMDVTSSIRPGVLNLTPSADAIQEESVQVNTYTVDYGRASSIQMVMTTKSGTNSFHGYASDYYTYQGLTARGEFGVPQPTPLNPYHSDNMSFGVGGPLIPHKQFFFFVDYEPYLSLTSNGGSRSWYEAPEFLSFAQQVQPNSPEVQLMAKYKPTGATTLSGSQYVETAGQLWPGLCETPAYDNIPCSTPVFDQGYFNSSSYENAKQYNIRIDKYFTKDRVYGQFFRDTINQGGPSIRPAFATTNNYYTFSLQGNETHTFSPNTLNEAIFGYNRIEGIQPKTGLYTVPIVNVNQLGVGWGDGFADGDYIQHSYHWRDVLTHIVGSHSFKTGFEAWRGDDIALFAGAYGIPSLWYSNMINLINDDPYSESGLSYNPVTGKPMPGNYGYKETTFGLFAEDTWKANHKLTVNYGIRYDNFGNPYTALSGTVLANFHLSSGATLAEQVTNGYMQQQSHVFNHDLNWVFSPRAGFAYDPFGNGKWVIHGGAGLYHDYFTLGNAENGLKGNPPGFIVPTFYNNGSTAAPIFGYGTQNTYPFGFQYPAFVGAPLDSKGGIVGSQAGVGGTDENLSPSWTLNWSGAVEREIGRDMVASLGYSGSHSGNLILTGGNTGNTSYGNDVNIFNGDLIQHPTFGSNGVWTGNGQQTRLNTSFGSITYAFNGAVANYDAFIASVKGKFGARGFVTASYTRSVSKDDWNNYPSSYTSSGTFNNHQWYSLSPWDAPNRFSLGWNYQMPGLTKGNRVLRRLISGYGIGGDTVLQSGNPFTVYNWNPLHLIDTTGVTVTQSNYQSELNAGNITFASDSGNYTADGDNYNIPNALSYKQKHDRSSYEQGHGGVISHSQFAQPAFSASGTEGNEKLQQFRNPGVAWTDFSVKKETSITEHVNLELRLDTYNLFNRVNLTGVDNNYGDFSPNFGTTSGNLNPRYMVIVGRLTF